MAKKSPMSLSLDYLAKSGWVCERVEYWNSFAGVRHDAFHFADILAYKPNVGIALVQTTSDNNFRHRRAKVLNSLHLRGWKLAGGRVFVHGWGGPKGFREEEV
jgi:hypothetical protein